MKHLTGLFLLTTTLLIACTDGPGRPTAPDADDSLPLVPLAVGARWTWIAVISPATSEWRWSIRISRDTVIDGETWYSATRFDDHDTVPDWCLWTLQSDGLWEEFLPGLEGPRYLELKCKYPATIGEIFEIYEEWPHLGTIWYRQFLGDTTIVTPLGPLNCLLYGYFCRGIPQSYDMYVPGIGRVCHSGPRGVFMLESYTLSDSTR